MQLLEKLLNNKSAKDSRITNIAIIMISISFFVTTCLSIWSINKEEQENAEAMSKVVAGIIYDSVNTELTKPIMVGLGMAHNSFLIDSLKDEQTRTEAQNVDIFRGNLVAIKKWLRYDTAFIVSEKSKCYYTYKGLNKHIDVENDKHDIWYKLFVDSGKSYDLDVDLDEVNGKRWTVFVNARLEDNEGNFMGACGVGVRMDKLQEILEDYEKEYDIKINMVNPEGLVQVDTDTVRIENAYLNNAHIGDKDSKDFKFEAKPNGGYVISKYVEDLGWYLIVQKESASFMATFSKVIAFNLLAYILVLLGLICTLRRMLSKENSRLMKTATIDRLTGCANRNYFNLYMGGDKGIVDQEKHPAIAVFDVDTFKEINDRQGHLVGDEILQMVSGLANDLINEKGKVLRWGGDEFVVIFNVDLEEALLLSKLLCKAVASEGKVTLSIGLAEVKANNTFKCVFYKADQAMYHVKEHGRNGVMVFEEEE